MSNYRENKFEDRSMSKDKLKRIASFATWPENSFSPLLLSKYGLRYIGIMFNVICDGCQKTTSLYSESLYSSAFFHNISTGLKRRLHEPNCPFLLSDHTMPVGRDQEITDTRCIRRNEHFQQYFKIALIMSCPCSACEELYRKDRECLGRQMPLIENSKLSLSGILHQLRRTASLDVFYDIHDARTRYAQCFVLNQDNSYKCVCCGLVKRDIRNADDDVLSDVHAKSVPTCPLLYLTKGVEYIHNKLQEIANELYQSTGNQSGRYGKSVDILRTVF